MFSSPRRIGALARLIVLDGMRSHAIIGLLCLALACEAGGLLFFGFIPRDIGRVSSDFIFSISFLTGLIFLFFHAVNVTAWGGNKRLIHTILARPLARADYVLGLFAGLAFLLLVLNLLLAAAGYVVLFTIKGQIDPVYFAYFSTAHYMLAWLGICVIELTLLSAILLLSGLVRGSFTVLLLSISYYLTCSGLPVVRDALLQTSVKGATMKPLLLKWLTALFPDFSQLDFKNYVISAKLIPDLSTLTLNFALPVAYSAVILWLACVVYSRKDLR
ncbi:MAG: hypothetical protein RBR22_00920 [Desulfuromonas sp.]|nr:hypothetical protein [Desulfuromonas sp.]